MENSCPKSPTMAAAICWPDSQPPETGPSWGDDFMGFSASKRRRSEQPHVLTDAAAPTIEMRLDDEARFIMSMLNDDGTSASTSTSSAPQKRRRRDDKSNKHEQPPCHHHHTPDPSPSDEAVNDPKRVKRILANRQSAQRSRVRKLQYISELERSMTRLQTEVSMLSPRVAYIDHQRTMLNVDNTALKSKIAALSHDKLFKDAHQEALKREIERLKQVYHQQTSVDDTTTNH